MSLAQAGIGERPGPGSRALGRAVVRTQLQKLLDLLVAFWIATGALVLFEPSPYEFAFILVLPVAFVAGMGIYRSTLGLLAIVIGFIPFALIGAFQVRSQPVSDALEFVLVTVFLLITAYFAANYVAGATERRMRLVVNAYTVAAVLCATIGALAYLGLMPSAETFLRYGRAKSTFNDPNVFGPFLILPAMYALQRVLLGRGRQVIFAAIVFMVLFVGVFVSFSRAAWGHFAFSSVIVLALCFWLEAWAHDKVRIIIMSIFGLGLLTIALGGLLSIPSVNALFETRASGQEYDSGETGRFGRQGFAFELALAHPWGIGPGEFHTMRVTEEPHDVYVQVLHAYGWGGGALYYLLVILTLWRGIASLRRPSPYRLMMIPLIATYSMVVGESAIIDSDHWRHYYLLVGLIWGVASAIGKDQRGSINRDAMLI